MTDWHKVYRSDRLYLGCVWMDEGRLHAEDRIGFAPVRSFASDAEAVAWLERRALVLVPLTIEQAAA